MSKTFSSFKKAILILVIIIITSCSKDSPVETGIDLEKLNQAFAQAEQIAGLKSLVVSKDGKIIKEQYWRLGGADKPHDVRSVTKTVTGILIGIAIDKGFINSADDSIGYYIKQIVPNIKDECASIKIKHLLTMSGGFLGNELANPSEYNSWVNSANQVNYILNKPITSTPGHTFNYNSAALHLLSVILSTATKMKMQDFAQKYLFDSLGITLNYWEKDHQGYNNGGAGLNISPHDMIKIGRLILDSGMFEGKRIVSSEWIDKTIQTNISTNNAQLYGPGYGYCIWTGENNNGNYAFANGYGGQFIVVVPSLKLVVAASNEWNNVGTSNANANWMSTLNLIMERVIPAFNQCALISAVSQRSLRLP